jgi:hypothetical protein
MAGVFDPTVFQNNVYQVGTAAPVVDQRPDPPPPGTGGGYSETWRRHNRDRIKRERERAELLALIRASDAYKRLQRKLAMLREHLLDSPRSQEIMDKIADIETKIEMMERL